VLTEVAFLTCRGREFQIAAPQYMKYLRKSSQLGFGVYSWLELVDLVPRLVNYSIHYNCFLLCTSFWECLPIEFFKWVV